MELVLDGVPSPAYVSKYQHRGKVATFEPQETIKLWFMSSILLNTSPKSHLQNRVHMMPFWYPLMEPH